MQTLTVTAEINQMQEAIIVTRANLLSPGQTYCHQGKPIVTRANLFGHYL